LRHVSGEIDYERLNYSHFFTNYLEKKVGDYDDFIERLERICSVIFSYTFLLFLLFLSTLVYLFVLTLPFLIGDRFGIDIVGNIFFIFFSVGIYSIGIGSLF